MKRWCKYDPNSLVSDFWDKYTLGTILMMMWGLNVLGCRVEHIRGHTVLITLANVIIRSNPYLAGMLIPVFVCCFSLGVDGARFFVGEGRN